MTLEYDIIQLVQLLIIPVFGYIVYIDRRLSRIEGKFSMYTKLKNNKKEKGENN